MGLPGKSSRKKRLSRKNKTKKILRPSGVQSGGDVNDLQTNIRLLLRLVGAPRNVTGLVLWLDAMDEGTMTRDGWGRVSQWNDKSGTGNHAVPITGNKLNEFLRMAGQEQGATIGDGDVLLPNWSGTGLNSKPTIHFSASSNTPKTSSGSGLFTTPFNLSNDYHIFMVASIGAANVSDGSLICQTKMSTTGQTHDAMWAFQLRRSGNGLYSKWSDFGGLPSGVSPAAFPIDTPLIISYRVKTDSYNDMRIFSSTSVTTTRWNVPGGNRKIVTDNKSPFWIGVSDAAGVKNLHNEGCNSAISEILYFQSALSDEDRAMIEAYLAFKWNLTSYLALQSNHPYTLDTTARMASGSIASGQIASSAIASGQIASSAVASSAVASAAIASSAIASNAVASWRITSAAFASGQIASAAQQSNAIASGQIASAMQASNATASAAISIGNYADMGKFIFPSTSTSQTIFTSYNTPVRYIRIRPAVVMGDGKMYISQIVVKAVSGGPNIAFNKPVYANSTLTGRSSRIVVDGTLATRKNTDVWTNSKGPTSTSGADSSAADSSAAVANPRTTDFIEIDLRTTQRIYSVQVFGISDPSTSGIDNVTSCGGLNMCDYHLQQMRVELNTTTDAGLSANYDTQQAFIETPMKYYHAIMTGDYIGGDNGVLPVLKTVYTDSTDHTIIRARKNVVFIAYDFDATSGTGATKMVLNDGLGTSKMFVGAPDTYDPTKWSTYASVDPGHYIITHIGNPNGYDTALLAQGASAAMASSAFASSAQASNAIASGQIASSAVAYAAKQSAAFASGQIASGQTASAMQASNAAASGQIASAMQASNAAASGQIASAMQASSAEASGQIASAMQASAAYASGQKASGQFASAAAASNAKAFMLLTSTAYASAAIASSAEASGQIASGQIASAAFASAPLALGYGPSLGKFYLTGSTPSQTVATNGYSGRYVRIRPSVLYGDGTLSLTQVVININSATTGTAVVLKNVATSSDVYATTQLNVPRGTTYIGAPDVSPPPIYPSVLTNGNMSVGGDPDQMWTLATTNRATDYVEFDLGQVFAIVSVQIISVPLIGCAAKSVSCDTIFQTRIEIKQTTDAANIPLYSVINAYRTSPFPHIIGRVTGTFKIGPVLVPGSSGTTMLRMLSPVNPPESLPVIAMRFTDEQDPAIISTGGSIVYATVYKGVYESPPIPNPLDLANPTITTYTKSLVILMTNAPGGTAAVLDSTGKMIKPPQPGPTSIVKYYEGTLDQYDPNQWPTYTPLGTRGTGYFMLNIDAVYTNLSEQTAALNKGASAAIASSAMASNARASNAIASGQIASAAEASNARASNAIASGQIASAAQASNAAASNAIASGQIASSADASNARASNAIASGQIVSAAQASNAQASGQIASAMQASNAVASAAIASSAKAYNDQNEALVASAAQASNAQASNAIASGQIASAMQASNAEASGQIASAMQASNAQASGQIASAMQASNAVASGQIASAMQASNAVASGQIASAMQASNAVASGQIASAQQASNAQASAAYVSGQFASGQIASMTQVSAANAQEQIDSAARASGQIASSAIASAAYASGQIASTAVVSAAIADRINVSAAIASGQIASSAIVSSARASGQIASSAIASAAQLGRAQVSAAQASAAIYIVNDANAKLATETARIEALKAATTDPSALAALNKQLADTNTLLKSAGIAAEQSSSIANITSAFDAKVAAATSPAQIAALNAEKLVAINEAKITGAASLLNLNIQSVAADIAAQKAATTDPVKIAALEKQQATAITTLQTTSILNTQAANISSITASFDAKKVGVTDPAKLAAIDADKLLAVNIEKATATNSVMVLNIQSVTADIAAQKAATTDPIKLAALDKKKADALASLQTTSLIEQQNLSISSISSSFDAKKIGVTDPIKLAAIDADKLSAVNAEKITVANNIMALNIQSIAADIALKKASTSDPIQQAALDKQQVDTITALQNKTLLNAQTATIASITASFDAKKAGVTDPAKLAAIDAEKLTAINAEKINVSSSIMAININQIESNIAAQKAATTDPVQLAILEQQRLDSITVLKTNILMDQAAKAIASISASFDAKKIGVTDPAQLASIEAEKQSLIKAEKDKGDALINTQTLTASAAQGTISNNILSMKVDIISKNIESQKALTNDPVKLAALDKQQVDAVAALQTTNILNQQVANLAKINATFENKKLGLTDPAAIAAIDAEQLIAINTQKGMSANSLMALDIKTITADITAKKAATTDPIQLAILEQKKLDAIRTIQTTNLLNQQAANIANITASFDAKKIGVTNPVQLAMIEADKQDAINSEKEKQVALINQENLTASAAQGQISASVMDLKMQTIIAGIDAKKASTTDSAALAIIEKERVIAVVSLQKQSLNEQQAANIAQISLMFDAKMVGVTNPAKLAAIKAEKLSAINARKAEIATSIMALNIDALNADIAAQKAATTDPVKLAALDKQQLDAINTLQKTNILNQQVGNIASITASFDAKKIGVTDPAKLSAIESEKLAAINAEKDKDTALINTQQLTASAAQAGIQQGMSNLGINPTNGKFILNEAKLDQTIKTNGISGRYIRLRPSVNNGDGYINLSQVVVVNQTGKNVAMGMNTYASSTLDGTSADTIVDGQALPRGIPNIWSSATSNRQSEFIEIDLGKADSIVSIRVLGRNDCPDTQICLDRMYQLRVEINNSTTSDATSGYAEQEAIVKRKYIVPTNEKDQLIVTDNVTGRYVRIRPSNSSGDGYISLSQAVVYNVLGVNIAKNMPTFATSSALGSKPSTIVDGIARARPAASAWQSGLNNRSSEFVEIDLGSPQVITGIHIVGISDCSTTICKDRMMNLRVEINESTTLEAMGAYEDYQMAMEASAANVTTTQTLSGAQASTPASTEASSANAASSAAAMTASAAAASSIIASAAAASDAIEQHKKFLIGLGENPSDGKFILDSINTDQTRVFGSMKGGKRMVQKGGASEMKVTPLGTEITGRYIKIRPSVDKGDGYIHFSQIIIYDILGNNVAQGMPIYATSTLRGTKNPSILVDGKMKARTAPNIWHSATSERDDEYIEIDLGSPQVITGIRIIGRADCPLTIPKCQERMRHLRIEINDEPTSGSTSFSTEDEVTASAASAEMTASAAAVLPDGKYILSQRSRDQTIKTNEYSGRYVRVRPSLSDGDGYIHISQIIVTNPTGNNIAMGVPVYTTSSMDGTKPDSIVVDGTETIRGLPNIWHSGSASRESEFIEVDLGSEQKISSIRIIGRNDCPIDAWCDDRMLNARVEINRTTSDEAMAKYKEQPTQKRQDVDNKRITPLSDFTPQVAPLVAPLVAPPPFMTQAFVPPIKDQYISPPPYISPQAYIQPPVSAHPIQYQGHFTINQAGGGKHNNTSQDKMIYTNNFQGRYIRLRPSESDGDGYMHLSQVMVYNILGVNISLGKPVFASSSLQGSSPPSIVVDGTPFIRGSTNIWHSGTTDRDGEFIEIDLGSSQPITSIRILGRNDCGNDVTCNQRMANLRLEINEWTSDEAKSAYAAYVPIAPITQFQTIQDSVGPVMPAPVMPAPDVSVPDMSVPDMSVPDMSVPDMSVPDMSVPDTPIKPLNTVNITSSANTSSNIKLKSGKQLVTITRDDPSLPTGYTKVWDKGIRDYLYQDSTMQIIDHPLPPSKRKDVSKVKRPSDNTKQAAFAPLAVDVQILSDPTLTGDWLKYFDTNIRKYYYYNSKTAKERWEHPFPPRLPVSGETKYGDSGMPGGWNKYMDQATNKYFYHNYLTGEVIWDHPNPPPFPENMDKIPNDTIPSTYVVYRDPKSGSIFYYNTLTTETSWTLPSASSNNPATVKST